MIVRRGKNACTTFVETYDGRERVKHLIVGSSPLDCTRLAGRYIAEAMRKSGHEASWNSEGGNEIRLFHTVEEYSSGDRYIRSYLTTVSDNGRAVCHGERRRANPSWEGLKECELCHKRKVGVAKIRNEAIGRDMLVCPADRKAVRLVNSMWGKKAASGGDDSCGGRAAEEGA